MPDYKAILTRLHKNLAILGERESKYGGDTPIALYNQIKDHREAITLTEQVINGEIGEETWREATKSLVAFSNDQVANIEAETYVAGDLHIHPSFSSSSTRPRSWLYALLGSILALAVSITGNLLSAAIQQRYFAAQFSDRTMWGLAIFAVIGALVGLWLSGLVSIPASAVPPQVKPILTSDPHRVMITRLRAFLSYSKLRGKGIILTDILLIGSKLDIDTRD